MGHQPSTTGAAKFRAALHKWMPGLFCPAETEVRHLHEELREHERELRTIFFNASVGMARSNTKGVFIEVNDKLAMMLGYTRQEMEGKMTLEDVCHPDDLLEDTTNFKRLVRGEIDTYSMVKRKLRKDGGFVWVRRTVSAVKDDNGNLIDCISVVQDITGQIKAEEAALENQRRFELLANAIPQLAWMASADGNLIWYSDRWYEYTGATWDDLKGQGWQKVHDPKELPRVIEKWNIALETGEPIEMIFPLRGKDGTFRQFLARGQPSCDENGKIIRWFGTCTDITSVLKAEADARKFERQFQLLANSIPQLAWMARPDGHIFWYNQRWYDYTGETAEAMEGWGWSKVHDPKELGRVVDGWKRSIAERRDWEDIFPLRRHDGQFRPHLTRARPVFSENGEIDLWFGTNTDITDLQQAEEAALAASRAKDRFIAVLSHELRTPLTPVLSGIDILENEMGKETLSAPALDALNMIRHNVRLEATLIDDLLDLTTSRAKKIKLELNPTDFYEVLNRSFQAFSTKIRAKQIRVRQKLEAGDSFVLGHAPRLHQIVSNLLGNAVKFTPDKGEICIHVSDSDGFLVVEIKDTGIGIEPGVLDRIFEPFEQHERKAGGGYGGLGLGLTIAKNLTMLHNGQISAHSEGSGKGATFILKLPKAERPSDALPSPPMPVMAVDPNKARVLLVEDHRDTLRSMAFLIRQLGYEVQTAATVKEGEMHALEGDILVSDIGLPDGNGYGLMRTLRKRGIRGVAVSGFGQEEDIERSREAGFSKHLVKPVDRRMLEQALRQMVATRHPDWLN